ncbi:MAG TPA: DUF58 domain-containing protein [Polyangiaceae bacterium]|nr:DUF58 domain-containing protein [Polyangiaceae bacterium]
MEEQSLADIVRKVRQIEIRTRRLVNDAVAGHYHSVFRGRGIDFDEVREYVPGDDVRTIDWNVTARAGHPFVKKFREDRELTILLLVDVSGSLEFGSGAASKRELEAELASVLALSATRNNDKVGLVLFTDDVETYIAPKKGRFHVLRVVREILGATPRKRGTDVARALRFVNEVTHRRAIVFLLSDLLSPRSDPAGLRDAVRLVRRRHDLVVMHIRDPREQTLPNVGLLTLEDAETGELVELDTGKRKVRERYATLAEARRLETAGALRREGVDCLEIDTARPYLPPLLAFFKNRERRLS